MPTIHLAHQIFLRATLGIHFVRPCLGWLLTGGLVMCVPGVLQAQAVTETTAQNAAPLIPSSIPDATASPTGPAQPGKLLRNTVPAPALTGEEKFHDRVGNVVGLRGWLGTAVGAGLGTAFDVPKEWDTHISGYGLRYASGIGVNLTHQAFGFGLDNALHEDPRYFPSEEQGFKPRFMNVLKQSVISRRDDGTDGVAYRRLISAFASAQVAGAWQPPSNQGVGNGLERGVLILAGESAINFIQEFVPFTRPASIRHRQ